MAIGQLRNDQMGNATGIQNLVRNIGGSFGISFVSTMLERYAQTHQAMMVEHLSPLNPAYQGGLARMSGLMGAQAGPADALAKATGSMYDMLVQQANYWAFVDLFQVIGLACAICFVGVIFLHDVKPSRPVAAH
jgi:DHA2 family multidrug resistance protein